jgi:surfactin synthase thioesterase subunit
LSWLLPFSLAPAATRTLYCVPHAGAGASIYRAWAVKLAPDIAVVGVQPPGRENRFGAQPLETVAALGREAAAAIATHAHQPFAVFGHSLGGLIAFEASRALEARQLMPSRVIVSGCRAPQLPRDGGDPLDDEALIQRLHEMGGTPAAVLASREILAIYLPLLRADFSLAMNYSLTPGPKLRAPLAALGGLADENVPRADLLAWRLQAGSAFEAHVFPGGHFYHQTEPLPVLTTVARLVTA